MCWPYALLGSIEFNLYEPRTMRSEISRRIVFRVRIFLFLSSLIRPTHRRSDVLRRAGFPHTPGCQTGYVDRTGWHHLVW
jgi:hypothetical protein